MTTKAELEIEKIHAEIGKLMAETAKLNKELRWCKVTVIVAVTLVVVAIVKLFI